MVDNLENRFEAVITILDHSLNNKLTNLYKKCNTPISLLTPGFGSAKSKIYDILGYGGRKKIVALSLQTKKTAEQFMTKLHHEIDLCKPGTGIVCSISLSSISSVLKQTIEEAEANTEMGSEKMPATDQHHLIISIINSGFFEQVMDAAKKAGAEGGTMIHARGLGSHEAVKYLGITIQPEKDLVLIIAPDNKKKAIMESITKEVGLNTAGNGICFSLPVTNVVGLDAKVENFDIL